MHLIFNFFLTFWITLSNFFAFTFYFRFTSIDEKDLAADRRVFPKSLDILKWFKLENKTSKTTSERAEVGRVEVGRTEVGRAEVGFTIFLLIWNQMKFYSVPNQSENGKYNLIPVYWTRMRSRFVCVCWRI